MAGVSSPGADFPAAALDAEAHPERDEERLPWAGLGPQTCVSSSVSTDLPVRLFFPHRTAGISVPGRVGRIQGSRALLAASRTVQEAWSWAASSGPRPDPWALVDPLN